MGHCIAWGFLDKGHGIQCAQVGSLTMARGTMASRSLWLMMMSATAELGAPAWGYSTCQRTGWLPDGLAPAISRSS